MKALLSLLFLGSNCISKVSALPLIEHSMEQSEKPQQITFVLPLLLKDAGRLPVQLVSLSKFAANGTVRELIMIVPDREKKTFASDSLWDHIRQLHQGSNRETIQRYIDAWKSSKSFPIRILGQGEVLPTAENILCKETPSVERPRNGGRGCGYRLQMLLKIGVANHVDSDFYVTLDGDVMARSHFDTSDMISPLGSNRFAARIQGETINGRTRHRPIWWNAAKLMLQAPDNCLPGGFTPTIGVTPAVIPKRAALAVMERVPAVWSEKLGPDSWDLLVFKALFQYDIDWTEYTMCFVAACATNQPDLFAKSPDLLYDWYDDLHSLEDVAQQVKLSTTRAGAPFAVLQGIHSRTSDVVAGIHLLAD
eukprot:gnl/TRDRNA2_/TRDRNA2_169564_c0_seq1.p1 gnl/TRDRNA2_/TRDRNA2_169564_c0~~gnl/TRDRNA2_/TRDRNA2_169564_c0_seq1.p1  ORF type:complete len:365 (+),score=19.44 gnl/TRDRNA2_/TRDRNA2_169564_c0_seq1:73-1167(+)